MIDLKDLYWAAGLLEGEGCFTTNTSCTNPYIKVVVGSTDEDVIYKLRNIFLVGVVSGPHFISLGCKDKYVWTVGKQVDSSAVMMMVYPLMCSRRKRRIEECLAIWSNTQSRKTFTNKYHEINRLYRRTNMTQEDVAKKYGITRDHVNAIVNNRNGKYRPAERK